MKYKLSKEKLKELLNAYFIWESEVDKEKAYVNDLKKENEEIKKMFLNKEHLNSVGVKEFDKNIFDYSRKLEGPAIINLGEPRLKGESKNLKRNLFYLIESEDGPFDKAQKLLEGEYKLEYFSKAFWSPILQAAYPEILPNWNNKTERFFKQLGINLKSQKLNTKEKYKIISNSFKYFLSLNSQHSFYSLNHLMHFGTEVKEGINILNSIENKIKNQITNKFNDNKIKNLIINKKQIILYGPPGTGKTYNTKYIAINLLNN